MSLIKRITALTGFAIAFIPHLAFACACGCGVFEVGTGAMLPTDTGGEVWLEYDFMNQAQNWHNASSASSANNPDKALRSNFFTLGGQYMLSRSWGVEAEIPMTDRYFETTDDDTGDLNHFQHHALGDVRLKGIYSGFSDDMSTGVTFGVKLPNGDYTYPNFDRDTAIGSGSTNLLLGFYHMGEISKSFTWFTSGQYDHAVISQDSYTPGDEIDAAIGIYYNAGKIGGGTISPLLQLVDSERFKDSGAASNRPNSGYSRLLISPGLEYDINAVRLYGDVGIPVYQHVNGNQIVAPIYFKFILGYNF